MKHRRRFRKGECDIEIDEDTYTDEDETYNTPEPEKKGWW